MIRTGEDYRAGLRDGREVWIDGARVADVTTHKAFKPIVDAKARMHDLLNSDYAGHRLTFVRFAQAPHFNHLNAVYNAFDFSGPLDFVRRSAGLSDRVSGA